MTLHTGQERVALLLELGYLQMLNAFLWWMHPQISPNNVYYFHKAGLLSLLANSQVNLYSQVRFSGRRAFLHCSAFQSSIWPCLSPQPTQRSIANFLIWIWAECLTKALTLSWGLANFSKTWLASEASSGSSTKWVPWAGHDKEPSHLFLYHSVAFFFFFTMSQLSRFPLASTSLIFIS